MTLVAVHVAAKPVAIADTLEARCIGNCDADEVSIAFFPGSL